MSNDIAAVKRLLTNLKTMRTKAIKAAAADKAAREERTRELLRDYRDETDIQNAYGYEEITEDERDMLLKAMDGLENPERREMSESEIYELELKDIIARLSQRLRDLEWEELPPEERSRILESSEQRRAEMKARKEDHQ